ncbi:MAG TPA: alpha/beta fold hydrolase, partial [Actinopolymorphaceae bacterium]
TLVVSAPTLPGTTTFDEDAEGRKFRKDKSVSAILHDSLPIRNWDHHLGPDQDRLFVADTDPTVVAEGQRVPLRDLTPTPGFALDDASFDVTPDGRTAVTTWNVREEGGETRVDLVAIDLRSGERTTLASDSGYVFGAPVVSSDGRGVVTIRERLATDDEPTRLTLWLVDLDSGEGRDLTPDLDLWPHGAQWSPDGRTVYFLADEQGRGPVFAVEVASGAVRRLTRDGTYSDLQVSPDGTTLYALRTTVDAPPEPVRLAADAVDQQPTFLRGPVERPELPGTLTEVTATAEDGTPLRAWLVLPEGASAGGPAPLLLWIHGGPYASWNGWQWRWNPWLAAARGYAVLLPDPALSTGYGQGFLRRGYRAWGGAPYTDLMTLTDVAVAREDVDESRTAAMGGSFGGYMANWVAGHTDRFDAIVTHASLWALDQFGHTTDFPAEWKRELPPDAAHENSPHRFANAITTPMLVIHGDRDYRVPVGEALRLWTDLVSRHRGSWEELPHRFLYFPDENHWILSPNHVKVWYDTVFAFLAWHVLGKGWEPPAHV